MFGVLAVMGDAGAAFGPWLAGAVAQAAQSASAAGTGVLAKLTACLPADGGSGLRVGLLVGTVFPVVIVVTTWVFHLATKPGKTSAKD